MEKDYGLGKLHDHSPLSKSCCSIAPYYFFMNDRAPINESEVEARQSLVSVSRLMLSGKISFFEGAILIRNLKDKCGGLDDHDQDFLAFVVIASETDHLPLAAQRHLWNPESLKRLESEFIKTEEWASTFAFKSCENLIERFNNG